MKKYVQMALILNTIFLLGMIFTFCFSFFVLPKPKDAVFVERHIEKLRTAVSPQINDVAVDLLLTNENMYQHSRVLHFRMWTILCVVLSIDTLIFALLYRFGKWPTEGE